MAQKIRAYQIFAQIGCIAQGCLQHLSLYHAPQVWRHFRSWLRTLRPGVLPSEQVVAMALSSCLPEFILGRPQACEMTKIMVSRMDTQRFPGMTMEETRCA